MNSLSAEELLESMKKDYVHGSSWYYEMSIEYVEKYVGNISAALDNLSDVRPGMASISNIIEILSAMPTDRLKEAINNLKAFGKIARKKISENLIEANTVITISNSSAVKELLMASGIKRIYLMESVPGDEVQTAKTELSKFADVTVIPDSSVSQFAEFSDYAVIGFDGLYSGGYLTNKVGSLPLVCISNHLKLPVVAVGESYKATEGFPPPPLKVDYRGINIGLFERVPLSFISELITDAGSKKELGPNDVSDIKNFFTKSILNNGHVEKP
ncbi:MAG: hypothetical protein JRN26_06405 [Nitrososphaerota archaeon]|jgi:translation initiation factor eIF-2B subunit delta|nr:hypothetical protein [Nitrososphaerota archaeon]MDG6927138.1 hypothetical protein [Nitrososphaerota archaeon]MDG6931178.1 hypothetical protein [Nitrososphaerota archaeon]MDG6932318.1 hypothetical protein [Nitrososphaerota archaeon]MDG6936494.1 hypothetical protein [Nitrososphaerota archaeon]